jgi:hypothetical protein
LVVSGNSQPKVLGTYKSMRVFVADPDNKFLANFLLEILLAEICSQKLFMNQKVKHHRFLNYLWLLHTSKFDIGSLIKDRIRIWIRSQTSRSGSATLVLL